MTHEDLLLPLLGKAAAELGAAAEHFRQVLAQLAKALAAAFPGLTVDLAALSFPRAHHPLDPARDDKHDVHPSQGGTEISAEVCQRLGVPRPKRAAPAPPAVGG